MFEGSEKARDKKTTVALDDYKNFMILPNEPLKSAFKCYIVIIARLINYGIRRTPIVVNHRFWMVSMIVGILSRWSFGGT